MADTIDRAMQLARIITGRNADLHVEIIRHGSATKSGDPPPERWVLSIRDARESLASFDGATHEEAATALLNNTLARAIEVTRSAIDTLLHETDAASVLERVAPQLFERLRAAESEVRWARAALVNANTSLAVYRAKHPCPFCEGLGSVIGDGGADEPCAECEERAESAKAGAK